MPCGMRRRQGSRYNWPAPPITVPRLLRRASRTCLWKYGTTEGGCRRIFATVSACSAWQNAYARWAEPWQSATAIHRASCFAYRFPDGRRISQQSVPMRILLIEDHPIVRAGCRRLLQEGGMEIDEAATIADGLRKADELSPDIIVLDLKLPDGTGLDLLGRLSAARPGRTIIVFSMYEDPAFAARALEAGAGGYMTKNDDPDLLLQAIETVGAGGIFLTPAMAEKLALIRVSVT